MKLNFILYLWSANNVHKVRNVFISDLIDFMEDFCKLNKFKLFKTHNYKHVYNKLS